MKTAYRLGRQALGCYLADQGTSFAAAIAYYSLFSIFPLSAFFIGFAGYFMTNAQRDALVVRLANALGGASTASIRVQIQAVSHGKAGLGLVGLVAALWSASAVFSAIRTGLNVVWKHGRPRSWVKTKLLDISAVLGLTLVLATAVMVTAALTRMSAVTSSVLGPRAGDAASLAFGLTLSLLPVAMVFSAFSLLYVWASPPTIGWRHIWPGSLFAAAGFVALSLTFGLYVRSFGHYDKVYGSLGAVIAFLFYAYLIGTLILLGAELAEQYVRFRRAGVVPAEPAGDAAEPASAGRSSSAVTVRSPETGTGR